MDTTACECILSTQLLLARKDVQLTLRLSVLHGKVEASLTKPASFHKCATIVLVAAKMLA